MLSQEDSQLLRESASECKNAKERERLRALYAISIGHPVPQVAEIFCVDEATIYRWIEHWEEEKNLRDKPREGRPPSLDKEDKREVKKLLKESSPQEHGINASTWTCRELRLYFLGKGKDLSEETLRVCLIRMGAKYVKATLKYAEADLKDQEKFARRFMSDMKAKANSIAILFEDEMSANTSARRGYGWTFEERLVIRAPQSNKQRLNCFGAVNPLKGEVIEIATKEAKAPGFIRLLEKILKTYPRRRIWMYLDRGPVHRSSKVQRFLEKHSRLELRFLPPYSPDMNPQEHWWNFKRQKFLNNLSFSSGHSMALRMARFTRTVPAEQVRQTCSLAPITNLLH
jgi:transposase